MDNTINKCSCYYEEARKCHDPLDFMPSYKKVPICCGTKEREECTCGGDESKCDFYPEKREAAKDKVKAEFSKMCDMNAKELLGYIIEEVATRRNINALVYLNDDSIHISIYPYEEDEE